MSTNKEIVKRERKYILRRILCIMLGFVVVSRDLYSAFSDNTFQVLSLVTSCLVVRGFDDEDTLGVFREDSDHDIDMQNLDLGIDKVKNNYEELPMPLPQSGPDARNYLAYIPVPINDDDKEEDEYYDDVYYDDEDDD